MRVDEDGLAPTLGGGSAAAEPWPVETRRAAIRFRMPSEVAEERAQLAREIARQQASIRAHLRGIDLIYGPSREPSEHLGVVSELSPPPRNIMREIFEMELPDEPADRRWWQGFRPRLPGWF